MEEGREPPQCRKDIRDIPPNLDADMSTALLRNNAVSSLSQPRVGVWEVGTKLDTQQKRALEAVMAGSLRTATRQQHIKGSTPNELAGAAMGEDREKCDLCSWGVKEDPLHVFW